MRLEEAGEFRARRLVGLGGLPEFLLGLLITRILIRMVLESLLDFLRIDLLAAGVDAHRATAKDADSAVGLDRREVLDPEPCAIDDRRTAEEGGGGGDR